MHKKNASDGFTLIEMSIVLVIIGLIVGGVFLGQSLIRQSEINSAMSDEQRYVAAVSNFQQKYGALPGDFATATSYWTAASGGCTTPSSTTTTCNGDGNGQIGASGTSTFAPAEEFLFWQHLDLAQMIQGAFNGTPGSGGTDDHTLGKNCPASKLDGAGFGVAWVGIVTASTAGVTYPASTYPSNNLGHVFVLGGYSSNNLPANEVMTGQEAFAVDTRYDDGVPATGNIETWLTTAGGGYAPTCSASGVYANTAGYKCSLIFVTGF